MGQPSEEILDELKKQLATTILAVYIAVHEHGEEFVHEAHFMALEAYKMAKEVGAFE